MKKVNTRPISGMQEFLPPQQTLFDRLLTQVEGAYRRHGYLHVETPGIERLEILLAKAGGETEQQIYKVVKTKESAEEADQGLRFDHTVPLARYIVEHEGKLTFPFKVMQIGQSWRGERAQKGRFREFYQADIDVIGRGKVALAYDADVITTMMAAYQAMGLKTPVVARVSNRKILSGFLRALGLAEKATQISRLIDHAEKISREEVRYALGEMGLEEVLVKKILDFIEIRGSRAEVEKRFEKLGIDDDLFAEGVEELMEVMRLLEEGQQGELARYEADLKIVRGLDYYTGTVFEFGLPKFREIGSIGGGGRYDNLAQYFSDQQYAGVGGAIGLSRLFPVLIENGLLETEVGKPLDYVVIPISDAEIGFANQVAEKLRRKEEAKVSVLYLDKKLSERLGYAARLADKAIVIGEREVETGEYQVKTFE